MKRLLLAIGLVVAFYAGYGAAVKAYPAGGVYGRAEYHGYFTNANDSHGSAVLPQYCSGRYYYYNGDDYCNAIPQDVNSASDLISFIEGILANTGPGTTRARTGAMFIVQTMIGTARNRPPNGPQMAAWRNIVTQYGNAGRIQWDVRSITWNMNTYFQGTDADPVPSDVAFFDAIRNDSTIVFRNSSGGVAYALRRACGNPVGQNTISWLRELDNFTITGRTVPSSPTVKPGQSVTFRHYVRNNGPTSTGSTNIWWVAQSMPSGTTVAGAANSGTYAAGQEKNVNNHVVNVPLTAVVGSTICERVGWDPVNSAGTRNGRGAQACVTVIPDFNLTPSVEVNRSTAGEGDSIQFTYKVVSNGVTPSTSVDCKPVGNTRPPGYTPLPQQDVDRTSDAGYVPPTDNCPRVFQPGILTDVATETVTLGAIPAGSRVCRSLVVTPKNETGGPRASAETCVLVAKTPYVHFNGNDVFAGGGFAAITPTCDIRANITTVGRTLADSSTAGSVGEYGVLALGRVTSFGSSSKVLVGAGTLGAVSRSLTFANSEPNVNLLGYYGQAQHCINDYTAQFGSLPAIGGGTFNVGTRGTGQWRVTGNASFSGAMPGPVAGVGQQQVYYVQGNATITGSLTYPATYASTNAIPSLIIIATGNIYVAPTVTQMDGIFIARGNGAANGVFYTCWPRTEPASISNPCNASQLVVNGSVVAGRIDLFRSFGATGSTPAQRKDPAERFQFSPEMYIRNAITTTGRTTIQTTNVLELPPRF